MKPEDIQTQIYAVGKDNGYKENLRDWFKLIYQVIFGDENGPRMGFFISFFGVNETKQLIKDKIKYSGNIEAATVVGGILAKRAKKAGIKKVAFDRSGFKFHGRIQALADAARENGIEF